MQPPQPSFRRLHTTPCNPFKSCMQPSYRGLYVTSTTRCLGKLHLTSMKGPFSGLHVVPHHPNNLLKYTYKPILRYRQTDKHTHTHTHTHIYIYIYIYVCVCVWFLITFLVARRNLGALRNWNGCRHSEFKWVLTPLWEWQFDSHHSGFSNL